MELSTRRAIELSELAYGCSCAASVYTRCAAKAAARGCRGAARHFITRSARLNAVAVKAHQRLALDAIARQRHLLTP